MIAFEDEDGAGPSSIPFQEDPGTGSESSLKEDPADLPYPDTDDGEHNLEDDGMPPGEPKSEVAPRAPQKTVSVSRGSFLPRGHSTNKIYVLPMPSVHHRHRAIPIFFRQGRAERLEARPTLFGPPKIMSTNCFTHNTIIMDRLTKAWGFNVGSGPVWDLLEDRAWYKESIDGVGVQEEKEANRRPRVYVDVLMTLGWEILSSECVFTQGLIF